MLQKTKVSMLTQDGKLSYGIKVETVENVFVIPVMDVRDGIEARKRILAGLKAVNFNRGSRFMKPSYSAGGNRYQNSFKKSL